MSKISLFDILSSHGEWPLKTIKIADYIFGSFIAFVLPRQKIQLTLGPSIKKILIIRPGGIGDAVFLLPILRILRAKGMSIDVLCEPRNAEVFTSQGYSVYFYNRIGSLRNILNCSYDLAVDTEQWHYSSALVSYFIKTQYRIGFATRPLRIKLFNKAVAYGDFDYELDNFLRLFEGLLPASHSIKDINGSFDVPQGFTDWARLQIPEKSATIFLGASIPLRRLAKEQLKNIIDDLLAKNFCPVLLGGKDVLDCSQEIVDGYKGAKILNFVARTSLIESVAFIQRSQKFIGPDSGFMHLAAAAGVPVTAVFGPGNLAKWRPKGQGHEVISLEVPCSPCTRFGYTLPTCQGSYHCIMKGDHKIVI